MPLIPLPRTAGCIVCGPANPHGLCVASRVDTDAGRVELPFTPAPHHIGFDGLVHGGVLSTVADEAMVWAAIWATRRSCVAGELSVRFRLPVRAGRRAGRDRHREPGQGPVRRNGSHRQSRHRRGGNGHRQVPGRIAPADDGVPRHGAAGREGGARGRSPLGQVRTRHHLTEGAGLDERAGGCCLTSAACGFVSRPALFANATVPAGTCVRYPEQPNRSPSDPGLRSTSDAGLDSTFHYRRVCRVP